MSLSLNRVPLNHMCDLLDHQTPFVPSAITSDEVCNQGLSDGEKVHPLHSLLMEYKSGGGQYLTS